MASEYNERKSEDKRKENVVRCFLEKHLYSKFPDYFHNENVDRQKLGVDCEFTGKTFHYIADEKAATRKNYINAGIKYPGENIDRRYLNTFCLELSMRAMKSGKWVRYDGWWLNDELINNSLILIWIDRTKSGDILDVDDILEAEVVVVRKEAINKYLESFGWTKERLRKQVNEISNDFKSWNGTRQINGLKFNVAGWLKDKEAPINILIERETYRKLSDYNKIIKLD